MSIDGFIKKQITRFEDDKSFPNEDDVIVEMPIALVYNGISHAVMMATPCDLEEYAIGFSLSEEIVDNLAEIYDIETINNKSNIEINITISNRAFFALKSKRRTLMGKSGCGVCGVESIELLNLNPEPIKTTTPKLLISTQVIEKVSYQLPKHQFLMAKTGGAHAASWCTNSGDIIKVFEDVGRHNALDKLIGYIAQQKIEVSEGFVFMSSRGSYELVRKAIVMNIPTLATISAPTSLAIDIAKKAGLTLICFCRKNKLSAY